MSWLYWNCRGLGNHRTMKNLVEIVKSRKPTVIFLCETLGHAGGIEELRCLSNFENSFSFDRLGRGDSLALLWRATGISITGYSSNHIVLLV